MTIQEQAVTKVLSSLAEVLACHNCGARIRFGDLECPHCGADIEEDLRRWALRLLRKLSS